MAAMTVGTSNAQIVGVVKRGGRRGVHQERVARLDPIGRSTSAPPMVEKRNALVMLWANSDTVGE